MSKLSYTQKTVLLLYPMFYGDNYPINQPQEQKTIIHVNAQKMCYLLKQVGTDVGDFGFSWNFHGPFSPGLLAVLRPMDAQSDDVEQYYGENAEGMDTFSEDEQQKINGLINSLHLREIPKQDRPRWMELLGSIAFLSQSVLPGEDYPCIIQELIRRKPQFNCDEENSRAWDVLKNAKLLKLFA